MTVDLVIKNCNIASPEGVFHGGIAIEAGKIAAIASNSNLPSASRTIDAREHYAFPGIIDPHTHPGKRDFATDIRNESLAALVGGVTTMGAIIKSSRMGVGWSDAPPTSVSYKQTFPAAEAAVTSSAGINVYFNFGIVNDEQANEIPFYVKEYGVTSFKFYLGYMGGDRASQRAGLGKFSSRLGFPEGFDDGTVYLGFENIAKAGPPCIAHIHAENMEIVRIFFERVATQGNADLAMWNARSPAFCEAHHIRSYAQLAHLTGCPLYVVHLSTTDGLDEVIRQRREGVNITAETGPQWLIIDEMDDPPGFWGKVNPPIRDRATHEKLWVGLRDGDISCTGTDHVPNMKEQCHGPELMTDGKDSYKGTGGVGMQTMFPALLSEGVLKGRISLARIVETCCQNNALAAGLFPKKGAITPGADADLVIVDMKLTQKVTPEVIHSPLNAFFEGRDLTGWPVMTFLGGEMAFEDGEILAKPGDGKYLRRIAGSQCYPM